MPRAGSGLPFQEITSKLSADELVKRLKACSKYLADCDSVDDALSPHLVKLASVLIQPFLQHHRSREVRTLAACCVADIFRVFFPDPPYDDDQLKAAFSMFVSQLQGLEKPAAAAFRSSFQLLECLASIKAFNLCLSLDAGDIVADLFKMLFSIINNEQSSKVKLYMMEILSSVVQEGENLSQEVMDAILVNVVEPNKSENKAAYMFTVEFIRKNSSYLEPFIQLFFNNALVVGKSSESEVAEHLYELILELHAIDSSVLLSVLPQLEFKLKSSDTEERLEVTQLLAKMFSPKDTRLARENKALWTCFLGRFGDVSPNIRVECVKYSKYFLVYHPNLVEETAARLQERFHDKEEKVRMEVVRAISEAAADNMQAIPQSLLEGLQERRRDKTWSIRKEAMTNMARLYRQAMSSSFSSGVTLNTADVKLVSWIPTKILYSYYQNSNEDRLCVERCLLSCVIPVLMKEEEKVERLMHVYTSLDENATRAFDAMLKTRHQVCSHLLGLIQFHQDPELKEEKRKQLMMHKIILLARNLPDLLKSQTNLQELATMLDNDALREALSKSLNVELTCQEVIKAKAEVVNKLGSKPAVLETVMALLDHCCPLLVDARCVHMMVERVCSELSDPSLCPSEEEEKEEFLRAKKALKLIKVLAGIVPRHFGQSEVFERLIALLRNPDKELACDVLQILKLTGDFIDQSSISCLQPVLLQLAQKGSPELAKHAVRCIYCVFKEPKPILMRLFAILTTHLDYNHPHLHSSLVSLAQIARLQPAVFETKHKLIIRDFVVKKLLVTDRAQQEYREGEAEWCEDDEVSFETQTKVFGMKLLVCWLLGLQSDQEKASHPVLRLLDTVLAHDGDLQGDDNVSAPDRSRLRLAAASGLLKLAQSSHYQELITLEQFQRLALTMQDTCEQVRDRFVHKLNKGLKSLRLPLGYLSIFALAGIEPRKEIRLQNHRLMLGNVEKRRECLKQHSKAKENPHAILPEYALAHTVYILAHHPDFSRTKPQALDNFKDCLWFFLEPVVHRSDNYGFIRKLLESIRQTVDAQDPSNSEGNKNLYAVCDLALGVLTSKLTHIKIGDFPGNVVLPAKMFQSREKEAQLNAVKYLPPGYDCTPTKRALQTEGLSVASPNVTAAEDEVASTKKAKSPREKVAKTKTPTKGRPVKSGTPAKGKSPRTPRGKGQQKTKTSKARTQVTTTKDDSGVSDVEEKAEDEEMEVDAVAATPSRTPPVHARTAAQPARKRNVRRKVLHEQTVDSTGEEEEDHESPKSKVKEAEEEVIPSKPAKPTTRTRNVKRKLSEQDKSEETAANEVNHTMSESQSDPEAVPLPKQRKVQTTTTATPEPSISVKRKARRRR